MAAYAGNQPNKKQEVPATSSPSPANDSESINPSRTPADSPTPAASVPTVTSVGPPESLNLTASWASIVGAVLTVVALIVAIMIYVRQGREQVALSEKQREEFRKLTEQQTDHFKKLQDGQTKQFDALVRELSYEVHPIKAEEALERVSRWFADEHLVSFEFFSTFSVVPLFWDEEHRARKATQLLSDRRYRHKVKFIGPSSSQSEHDFRAVATFLVNSGPDKRPKTNRVINWLTDALVEMKAIKEEEARSLDLTNLEQVLERIRNEGSSNRLIDFLAETIGNNYRHEEEDIKKCVYYREQVATLKVNYALARFENKNPSEAFEMLVFADEEEDPLSLSATAKKPRHERILTEPQIYHTRNQLLMRAICDPVKTILMKTNQESVGRLTLLNIQHSIGHSTRGTVLILPNAYGILPYLEPLASELAENGWDTFWFAFSGQGTGGELSLASAVSDLSVIINHLKSIGSRPLSVIAHGAGAFAILEYLKNDPHRSEDLSTLIITGMLLNVPRVFHSDINEIEKHNVSARLSSEETEYNPVTALQAINIPVLFCHASDKRHLLRATAEEMNTAVTLTPNATIRWFDKGYDDDLEQLRPFVDSYIKWLSSEHIRADAEHHEPRNTNA